ncbi:hypothetical protein DFH09DRAFT_1466878 [Mycena vulgaris]|nr:hypothetical protein DFH09DRAFT_1466878 [Mycena vulgaris]
MDPDHAYPFCVGEDGNATEAGSWAVFPRLERGKHKKQGLDAQDLLVRGKVDRGGSPSARGSTDSVHGDGSSGSKDMCGWRWICEYQHAIHIVGPHPILSEVMICDFTTGVELLAADFLAAPWGRHIRAPRRALPRRQKPNRGRARRLVVRPATDLSCLVSFYGADLTTDLAPFLVAHRAGLEHWDHHVQSTSYGDLAAYDRERRGLRPLYRVLVDRYADRLELLEYLLHITTAANLAARAPTIQAQLRVMLTPYILYAARPSEAADDAWAAPV